MRFKGVLLPWAQIGADCWFRWLHTWLHPGFVCRGKLRDSSIQSLNAWATALQDLTTKTGWRGELYADG